MENGTAKITIICNPPTGFGPEAHFMVGINDEKLGEGRSNDRITIELPVGPHDIFILVRNTGLNSMEGSTSLDIQGDVVLKIKYSLFSKKTKLVTA